jgi:Ca2+-transporting ATPase
MGAVLLTCIVQLLITYVPFLQTVFKTQSLSVNEFIVVAVASSLVFFAVEIDKAFKRKRNVQMAS